MKNFRYVDYVMRRRSFTDFWLAMGMHYNPKEWTECVGMLNRAKHHMQDWTPDIAFDIGCGKRPTLGVLFALNVASVGHVACIDPQLDAPERAYGLKKITYYGLRLDTFLASEPHFLSDASGKKALILCNHAHVKKAEIMDLASNFGEWVYITCPCCVDNRLGNGHYYRDESVWSPKNEFYTFKSWEVGCPGRP